MIGRKATDRAANGVLCHAFLNQFAEHRDKLGVGFDGLRSDHGHPESIGSCAGFFIEIEQDFHVIRKEADGHDDDFVDTRVFQFDEMVVDIGFEPGVLGTTTAALVDQAPVVRIDAARLGDEATGFGELFDVIGCVGHRLRDAVGREGDVGS